MVIHQGGKTKVLVCADSSILNSLYDVYITRLTFQTLYYYSYLPVHH